MSVYDCLDMSRSSPPLKCSHLTKIYPMSTRFHWRLSSTLATLTQESRSIQCGLTSPNTQSKHVGRNRNLPCNVSMPLQNQSLKSLLVPLSQILLNDCPLNDSQMFSNEDKNNKEIALYLYKSPLTIASKSSHRLVTRK